MPDIFSWYNTSGALPASAKPDYLSSLEASQTLNVEFQDTAKTDSKNRTPTDSGWNDVSGVTQASLWIPVSSKGNIVVYFLTITDGTINTEDGVFRFYKQDILTKNSTVLSLQATPIRGSASDYGMIFAANLDAKDTNGFPAPWLILDDRRNETNFTELRVTLAFYQP